ncbi:MAG TPA: NTPase [Candidatus Nanoarchaeia archaeon]|nr:NTPase [Candidatus Nanoarchaeia archaeon]
MRYNILISGPPASGKSTLVREIIKDRNAGGILTPEIRKDGERFGFKVIDIKTNREAVFASIEMKPRIVSRYGLDIQAFEKIAIPAIQNAIEKSDFVCIDEIGAMEIHSPAFRQLVEQALDAKKVIATISFKSKNTFIEKVKERKDVKMHYLTRVNRERILKEVIIELK